MYVLTFKEILNILVLCNRGKTEAAKQYIYAMISAVLKKLKNAHKYLKMYCKNVLILTFGDFVSMCGGMKRDMREKQEVLIAFLHFGLLL